MFIRQKLISSPFLQGFLGVGTYPPWLSWINSATSAAVVSHLWSDPELPTWLLLGLCLSALYWTFSAIASWELRNQSLLSRHQ